MNTVVHFGETPEKAWRDFLNQSEKNKSRHRELCFMGTQDDITCGVEALQEAGMDEVTFLLGIDEADKASIIAEEIMPKFVS